MASTTLAAHSIFPPGAYLPSYRGLRGYYKTRNSQIPGGRDSTQATVAMRAVNDDQCPDTSNWPTADSRNSEYIVAVHIAEAVSSTNSIRSERQIDYV